MAAKEGLPMWRMRHEIRVWPSIRLLLSKSTMSNWMESIMTHPDQTPQGKCARGFMRLCGVGLVFVTVFAIYGWLK